jgi:hypothetical protein
VAVTRCSFRTLVPRAGAAVVLIVVSCAPTLLGQTTILPRDAAVREYEAGLSALKKGDFRTAKERMNAALATGHTTPAEGFGSSRLQIEWYDPYYWLGVAAMELGEDEAARRSFARSREGGVIETRAEYADLLARVRVLDARKAATGTKEAPPPAPASLLPLIETIAQGRFREAEAELVKVRAARPGAAEPELLAAVLYASRFVLEGSTDRSLLAKAKGCLETFRRRGGSPRAEEAWLSPALRALLAG